VQPTVYFVHVKVTCDNSTAVLQDKNGCFFCLAAFLIVSHCCSISDLVMELLSDQDRGAHTFEHSLAYCHDVLMY
jgi:hypothetical protein